MQEEAEEELQRPRSKRPGRKPRKKEAVRDTVDRNDHLQNSGKTMGMLIS